MDAGTLEYDHFGPWVLEIAANDPPPSIFLPYLVRPEEPLLAVKVPRRIDRRDARPGMDLYDYLICLYADDVEILHREGRGVRRWSCPYRDIAILSVTRTLLRGNIHLGIPGGACDLPFNTTGDQPIRRVVEILGDRSQQPSTGIGPRADADASDSGVSFYFEHLLADLRCAHPAMRLLAVQGNVPLATREATTLRRYVLRATGRRLLESMHLSDGRKLMIVDRGQRYAYRWESTYGEVTSHIPLAAVREAEWQDDAANRLTTLSIRTDGGAISHAFTEDNPTVEGYRTFLSRLLASRVPS